MGLSAGGGGFLASPTATAGLVPNGTSMDEYHAVGTPTGSQAIYHEYVPFITNISMKILCIF